MVIVLFPSPAGVGEIALTITTFAFPFVVIGSIFALSFP